MRTGASAEFDARRARAKRPLPLWVDAFQRDTQHLEADEVGAYMLVLMAMWTRPECDLPDDDVRLSRVARVSVRLWRSRIGPVIRAFFTVENGALISKRLRQEATYVERQCKAQSSRKSGEKIANELNFQELGASVDDPTDMPTDRTPDHPSQQPNNPTYSEDKSSDAGGVETDFAKRVFEEGVALLIRHGLAEKQARSTIGRWRKEQSDPALIEAFTAFAGSGAVDPVGWISARFAKPKAPAPASFEQQVVFFAEWLRSDSYVPSSAISATMARELVARKLVEPETLRAKGILA
jgi:uncharacterized protein YdaU (DUF1376 family)